MRAAVLHVNTASSTSTSPTMRIARWVASHAGLPLISDLESADDVMRGDRVDLLFVKHGLLKFSKHREEVFDLYRNARHVVNLINDPMFQVDARLRKMGKLEIPMGTTCLNGLYVNWNVLTWNPLGTWVQPKPFFQPTEKDLFYYGAYRPGRQSSFERYLTDPDIPLAVCSYKGIEKFHELNPRVMQVGKLEQALKHFPMSLYIEDDYSHDNFTSPANRFYECLQEGVAMVFDPRTVPNLLLAGIDASSFTVRGSGDIADSLPRYNEIRREQRRMWYRDYGLDLQAQFNAAYNKLTGSLT